MNKKSFWRLLCSVVLVTTGITSTQARQLFIEPGRVNDIKVAIEGLVAGDSLWVKAGTYEVERHDQCAP